MYQINHYGIPHRLSMLYMLLVIKIFRKIGAIIVIRKRRSSINDIDINNGSTDDLVRIDSSIISTIIIVTKTILLHCINTVYIVTIAHFYFTFY
jgi:hypothetical protein